MASQDEIRQERLRKRGQLQAAGMNPYRSSSNKTHSVKEVKADFDQLEKESASVTLTGRLLSIRKHGGSLFADLFDGTARIQIFLSRKDTGEESFDLFVDTIDVGDFVDVTGTVFSTKQDVQTLAGSEWEIVTKSLQAIPTEHFGIKDEDERYRKRYLDLLLDEELRAVFLRKEKFWDITRQFMKEKGFMEVETPTLEVTTGGAEARPFKTYHHDYDMDVYLRISIGELWQKRLMAAGFPKVFEIGKAYRNEGTSPEHLQEFTNLEFYWAYADYHDGMKFVQELYRTIAQELYGTTKFSVRGHSFDLADEWQEIDYVSTIKDSIGIDIITATESEMQDKLQELSVVYEGNNRERLVDSLWKYCRKSISGPAFLVNHPVMIAPLAKQREDGNTVEMFQPIIAGSEVGRGYSELNDPEEQKKRFQEQQALLEAGDEEAMMPDNEFVEMLEYGMPPTCGFGFGERMFAFLEGKPLREVQFFPLTKPRSEQ